MVDCGKKRVCVKKILFGFLITSLLAGELKLTEVKPVLDEILAYHVDENIFTPKLALRSFKNYLTSFDPQYRYLLASEIDEILLNETCFWEQVANKYHAGDFSPYQNLNNAILKAILRSRKLVKQIQSNLISRKELKKRAFFPQSFSKNEVELYAQIEEEMEDWLFSYANEHDMLELIVVQKLKIFDFYNRKNAEHEEGYLSSKNISILVLKAIASSLDAHTMYYSEEEALEFRKILRKEFCGVGIQLKESVEGPFVSYIVPKSPAEASGLLKVGSIIKEIDGLQTDKINFNELLNKLIGDPHTTVSLLTQGVDGNQLLIKLSRERVTLEEDRINMDYEFFGDGIIGLITLPSFYDNGEEINAEQDLRSALSELKAIAPLNGLIIDMRKNSGGFLGQAVQAAGLFLQKGTVVVAKYANDEIRFTRNQDSKLFYQGPLVIMTSKASASAAEVVCQALQDEGVAIIVGDERSYGKGSMQYQTITDQNAKHYYKVTVGRYFTLSGKTPQIDGVKSDILVPTIYSTLNLGEKYLQYPISSQMLNNKKDIQKQLSTMFASYNTAPPTRWQKMLDTLIQNSSLRKENDRNFLLYYKQLEDPNIPIKTKMDGCGTEDLQKREAINIVKDMILIANTQ